MSDDATVQEAKAVLEYPVTPADLLTTLEHTLSPVAANGAPKEQANVMVWGAMGIGKSDICRTIGAMWGLRVVSLHLPQFDPTDLKGIPVLMDPNGNSVGEMDASGKVRWIPSSYLPKFLTRLIDEDATEAQFTFDWPDATDVCVHGYDADGKFLFRANDQMQGDLATGEKEPYSVEIDMTKGTVVVKGKLTKGMKVQVIDKAILFLDELSAAVPEVQNAALQLVLDKRVGEYDVPPFTPLVAAGNRESDQAFVSPMSMPLCNRFMHLRLIPSLKDWLEWAMINRVDPSILGYLQWKNNHLFEFNPDAISEGDCGFPTPRSWAKLSEQMVGIEALPDGIQHAIITGYIGTAVGQQFIAHRQIADLLPSTDDILQGKEVTIPEDLGVGGKYHLATALCYKLADYHAEHYDESVDADKQKKEWQVASEAFCTFIDENLGKEMTVLCVHITSRHLNVSFVAFRGEKFRGFAKRYRDILRKTV